MALAASLFCLSSYKRYSPHIVPLLLKLKPHLSACTGRSSPISKCFEINQQIKFYGDKVSGHLQSSNKRIIKIKGKNLKNTKNRPQIVEPRFFRTEELNKDDEPYDKKNEAMKGFAARLQLRGSYSKADMDEARKRMVIGQMKRRRYQTIEKKYFKKEVYTPPDLLTWRAMEQMRDLNFKDPVAWSEEELAEHYPVSLRGVRKILRSKKRLSRVEDVEWFNEKVRNNLLQLVKDFDDEQKEFPVELYKSLFDSKHRCVIKNANGLRDQPFLKRKDLSKKGEFSEIVKDCESPRTEPAIPENITPFQEVINKVASFFQELEPMSHVIPKSKEKSEKHSSHFENLPNKFVVGNTNESYDSIQPEQSKSPLAKHMKRQSATMHQKGNSIYDESGQFLFRVP